MKKKLTLTIEKSIKERAKRFAKKHNTSVSDIVERLLDTITREESGFTPQPGSVTETLMGSVDLPKEFKGMSYKEIKQKILQEKYDV